MVLILHTSTGFVGREKAGVAGGYSSNYSGNTLYAYRVLEFKFWSYDIKIQVAN
jgi:hypothetical protein